MNADDVEWLTERQYPDPDMSATEFEGFVAGILRTVEPHVDALTIAEHEIIAVSDGAYDLDVTVRFELFGAAFLVLVEAKMHKNPIKRELVQVLHSKVQSVGAHKGIMISTARYQSGAMNYALQHGIGLV